ncbi:hypothetical protein UFOVP1028_32 [uncultured Caudovirales phage]|uniref:Uncharacterized protein n=1 Tax=uncultured Caudovirales phage TaxID=2100421 RepID=A0A6J5RIF5_9CAUD|nr:hypothetical protein UFOVP960_43 [uncultured Caudovirales phage]CAB4179063.1 hypothetical protein UFOVP1028_32 [uncultured Caudovirales phage]CAB4189450.1 hypothetical protein UFOVP1187_33 [uncultured Caudovirales phage]CAB4192095.1 hypothetical protein UFOVP1235_4 [uncultured Caudovirales phage]CAB4215904.1 hypothetical protein UFOVP1488_33 [uncultured Caudovirales phage]
MTAYTRTNIAATTAAVTNRIVTSANMKVGAYTIANASPVWAGGALITVTHTEVGGGVDTLGTIVLVGKDLHGQAITETLTPVNGSTATSTKVFRSVTSATGVGWVIGVGNDTIVIGVAAGSYVAVGGGTLRSLVVNTTAAATVVLSDSTGTIATLKSSIAEGTYYYDLQWSGYLKVATTSTNDVTAVHSPGVPTTYAMA